MVVCPRKETGAGLARPALRPDQLPPAPLLYLPPGNLPNSLQQDQSEIGGASVASKYQFTFHLKSMEPTKLTREGDVRVVDSRNFPVSKHISRWIHKKDSSVAVDRDDRVGRRVGDGAVLGIALATRFLLSPFDLDQPVNQ